VTQEDRDRLSILLRDAHTALEEAWQLCLASGDTTNTQRLVIADSNVMQVDHALDLYSVRA
jgi:hypothetical protein